MNVRILKNFDQRNFAEFSLVFENLIYFIMARLFMVSKYANEL